jgi:hypothetical protein
MSNPNKHKFVIAYTDAVQYVCLKRDGALNYSNFKQTVDERLKALHTNDPDYKTWA